MLKFFKGFLSLFMKAIGLWSLFLVMLIRFYKKIIKIKDFWLLASTLMFLNFLWSIIYSFPYDIKFNTVLWAWENVVPNTWFLVYTYNVISKKTFLPFLHRSVKSLFPNLQVTCAAQTFLSKRGKPSKTKNLLIHICHPKNFPYKVSPTNLITSLL